MDRLAGVSAGAKLSPKLNRSWAPNSPRSAGKDQLCALSSALVQVFWVKSGRQEKRPFPGVPCAEGKNGWDEAWRGGNPVKSMRNSARKQQKEQFSRNYREGKKNLARDTA